MCKGKDTAQPQHMQTRSLNRQRKERFLHVKHARSEKETHVKAAGMTPKWLQNVCKPLDRFLPYTLHYIR